MINSKKKFNLHNISDKVKKNIQTFKASREKGIFPFLSNIVIFGSPNKSLSALVKNHENKKIHKNTHTRLREKTHERHPLPPEKTSVVNSDHPPVQEGIFTSGNFSEVQAASSRWAKSSQNASKPLGSRLFFGCYIFIQVCIDTESSSSCRVKY